MTKKKSVKKRSTKHNTGKHDQYTVVLEDLRSQFKVFGEGLSLAHDKLDEHTKDLAELKMEVSFATGELAIIRHNQVTRDEFKLLETRVARLERAQK